MKWKNWKRAIAFCMAAILLAGSANLTSMAADTSNIDYTGDSVQEIESGEFVRETEAFYGSATFYDYYSNAELAGKRLSEGVLGTTDYPYNDQAHAFNGALSEYYKDKGYTSKYPLYFGNGNTFTSTGSSLYEYNSTLTVNGWNNDKNIAQGMMDSITSNGILTQNGKEVPYFNTAFLRGENSLKAAIGQVYSNVEFPFLKNQEGYWEFESKNSTDSLELKKKSNDSYYLERRKNPIVNPEHPDTNGFFPLEKYDGDTSIYSRNNMFGMHMDIPFHITEDGKIEMANGTTPIVFEFAGDDDVWIFIDGVLVLDMGGIHGANGGTINFFSGDVTYREKYNDVLGKGAVATGINLNNLTTADNTQNLLSSLQDGEKHKICIYYLERGLHDSNLHIQFNFPIDSKLTVTNEIDTSAANQEVFGEALQYIGSFDYYLYNQAVSGDSLAVEKSAGYIKTTYSSEIVDGTEEEVAANVGIHVADTREIDNLPVVSYHNTWETPKVSEWVYGSEEVNKRLATINCVDFPINDTYAYLYMQIKSNVGSASGHKLYIQLNYSSGITWGSTADLLTYNNSSNGIFEGLWTELRLNLAEAPTGTVETISFAYMEQDSKVYLNKIIAYGPWEENPNIGFTTEQSLISDYGSIYTSADGGFASQLMPASSAFFEKVTENTTTIARVGGLGTFGLGNGQSAVFIDKFRFGSYMYLREVVTDNQKVFDTTYTMSEGKDGVYQEIPSDALAAGRTDATTIENSGKIASMKDVSGRMVYDGRTSIVEETPVSADTTQVPLLDESTEVSTFVYRNYIEPDIVNETGVDLKIDFVNTLRVGSVTVNKVLQWTDANGDNLDDTSDLDWETFKSVFIKSSNKEENESVIFRLTFTNIAGRYLETYLNNEVKTELNVYFTEYDDNAKTISGTATFDGIPAGTQYKIEEIQIDGIHLLGIDSVEQGTNDETRIHTLLGDDNTGVGSKDDTFYAEAIAYESNVTYTFRNQFTETTDVTVVKEWDDSVETKFIETGDEAQVTVELQRRILGGAWETVTMPSESIHSNPQTTKELKAVFDKLPTVDVNKNRYEYRVVETAVHSEMGDVKDYTIFYVINTDGSLGIINASSNRTYYAQNGVKRELPILPDNEYDKQHVYNNYDIQILDVDDDDVTATVFEILSDGTISYTAQSVGVAMYDVIFTKKDDASNIQTVKVAVYAYDAIADTYVLDYGKEVQLADHNQPGQNVNGVVGEVVLPNGLFANDVYNAVPNDTVLHEIIGVTDAETAELSTENGQDVSYKESAVGYDGTISMSWTIDSEGQKIKTSAGTDVIYTPTSFLETVDTYSYKTIIRSVDAEQLIKAGQLTDAEIEKESEGARYGVAMSAEINILPANNIYYEDTFVTDESTGTVGIVYGGSWTIDGTSEDSKETPNGAVHGWEEALADDAEYSDGSAHVSSTPGATATFTFTGTGVDVYSRTNAESGMILGMLYEGDSITDLNGKNKVALKGIMMDNKAESGDYYQIPTLTFTGLTYGTYTVKIVVAKDIVKDDGERVTYHLDGIRVYNPVQNIENMNSIVLEGYDEKEANATFEEIRDQLMKQENLDGTTLKGGMVFIDKDDKNVIAVDRNELSIFETYGPKNEVYLDKGQILTFAVEYHADAHYYVGLKSPTGNAVRAVCFKDGVVVNQEIKHTTDAYYEVTPEWQDADADGMPENGIITIKNEGITDNTILSVTKLRVTNASQIATASMFTLIPEEQMTTYARRVNFAAPEEPETPEDSEVEITNPDSQEQKSPMLQSVVDKLFDDLYTWFE